MQFLIPLLVLVVVIGGAIGLAVVGVRYARNSQQDIDPLLVRLAGHATVRKQRRW
jgi:hypothetical protein